MDFAICTVPAAPVRKEDSHRSEMVNQLLFGDTLEILEEKANGSASVPHTTSMKDG